MRENEDVRIYESILLCYPTGARRERKAWDCIRLKDNFKLHVHPSRAERREAREVMALCTNTRTKSAPHLHNLVLGSAYSLNGFFVLPNTGKIEKLQICLFLFIHIK